MQKASFRRPAIALALVLFVGGCSLGPGSDIAGFHLPWSNGDSRAKLPDPAKLAATAAGSTSVDPASDPISLATKAKPSPELYVATARLSEQSGKTAEAEGLYQKALKADSRHAEALVGYARLKDRQGRMDDATRLYRRAAQAHPNNASVHNDLGLCLARQRNFGESMAALERAINLAPKKWLYRNNLAMVLVETGRVDAAVAQLMAVQEEAVAHYNVAYILQKKGDSEAATRHFAMALQKNPSLEEARVWLAKLGHQPDAMADPAPRIASQRPPNTMFPATPSDTGPAPRGLGGPHTVAPPVAPQLPGRREGTNPWPSRPLQSRVPPVPDRTTVEPARPTVEAPAPDQASLRAELSNVAPLPPPMSIGQPTQGGATNRAGTPVVSPLPPIPPQYDSYRP